LRLIDHEADRRHSLGLVVAELRREADALGLEFQQAARSGCDAASRNNLRQRANSLVTRAAQASLTASKGAGFVVGHPAERLLRESMFFLVWSCPQPVLNRCSAIWRAWLPTNKSLTEFELVTEREVAENKCFFGFPRIVNPGGTRLSPP